MPDVPGPPTKWVLFTMSLMVFQLMIAGTSVQAEVFDLGDPPDASAGTFTQIKDALLKPVKFALNLVVLFFQLATFSFVEDFWIPARIVLGTVTFLVFVWTIVAVGARIIEAVGQIIPFT